VPRVLEYERARRREDEKQCDGVGSEIKLGGGRREAKEEGGSLFMESVTIIGQSSSLIFSRRIGCLTSIETKQQSYFRPSLQKGPEAALPSKFCRVLKRLRSDKYQKLI